MVSSFKKFLDPFLFLGIFFLCMFKFSGAWLSDGAMDHEMRSLVHNFNLFAAISGVLGVTIGVIRPIVRAMLERQYLAGLLFYGAFWLVLSLPAFYRAYFGPVVIPIGKHYWETLLALFLLVNALIGISLLVATLFPRRNKLG